MPGCRTSAGDVRGDIKLPGVAREAAVNATGVEYPRAAFDELIGGMECRPLGWVFAHQRAPAGAGRHISQKHLRSHLQANDATQNDSGSMIDLRVRRFSEVWARSLEGVALTGRVSTRTLAVSYMDQARIRRPGYAAGMPLMNRYKTYSVNLQRPCNFRAPRPKSPWSHVRLVWQTLDQMYCPLQDSLFGAHTFMQPPRRRGPIYRR